MGVIRKSMTPVYLECFADEADVISQFHIHKEDLKGAEILLAWYGGGDYCGSAFVLLRKGAELFEVNASHCSCYGIEGQWDLESTTVGALKHRAEQGAFGSYDGEDTFLSKLKDVVEQLK